MERTICDGTITLGKVELACAVLEDKTRVVSERSMILALGGTRTGAQWKRKHALDGGQEFLPAYLSSKNLAAFIDEKLRKSLLSPRKYRVGSSTVNGLEATLIPQVCEVYLRARDAGVLHKPQIKLAIQADALMRGLAQVGIIALVDEATGYDKIRAKDELAKQLAMYLSEYRLRWAKIFPIEFYKEIYRLHRWPWPPKANHPSCVGKITNEIIYDRMPKGLLEKLQEANPVDQEKHRRRWKHTQFLSEDIGKPSLRVHLLQVISLLQASSNWRQFMTLLDRVFPKGRGIQLTFEDVA